MRLKQNEKVRKLNKRVGRGREIMEQQKEDRKEKKIKYAKW